MSISNFDEIIPYGRIISRDRMYNVTVERWFYEFGNYILVRRRFYSYLRDIKKLFDKYHYVIAHLSRILIYDLKYLKGIHSSKNRVIARLYKFIRILKELGFAEYYEEEIEELKQLLEVMKRVKNEYHRIRDPIHELLYPYLRRTLRSIMEAEIRYELIDETHDREAYIRIIYQLDIYTCEYEHSIKICYSNRRENEECIDIDDEQLKEILSKQEEREIRKHENIRKHDMWMKYIEGNELIDPYEPEYPLDYIIST